MTRIHALCLVKNEADVIAETLAHAARFCHRIYVWDNGSTDDTWERVTALGGPVVPWRREARPFHDGLRAEIYHAVKDGANPGDWFLVLDADEFLEGDLAAVLARAEREGAEQINTLQYNFFFTERDLEDWEAGRDDPSRTIRERRRWYRFVNIEQRLFRHRPGLVWPTGTLPSRPRGYPIPPNLKKCSLRLANCHYQYRDPEQIRLRLETRVAARTANRANFLHYQKLDHGVDWLRYVVPVAGLHRYQGDGRFEITLAERWKLFRRHLGSREFFRFDFLAT
jgi:glycosyltransferase involved in cell wall biosynthesis